MNFWWVNHSQTFRHEFFGKYIWSPKRKRNDQLNPLCETMREVAPGDIVYVVMAIPNYKDEDMKYKLNIAIFSVMYTLDSVRAFADALGYDENKLPDDFGFGQVYRRALEANSRLIGAKL